MALDDIKKSILDEAKKEADRIRSEGKQEINKVNKRWAEKVDGKVKEIVKIAQGKADQKIQQSIFKIQASNQAVILKKKQKVIDSVYGSVLDKLKNLSDKDYIGLMEKLLINLPDIVGEIISVKGKVKILEKSIVNCGKDFHVSEETVGGRGGFIFRSDSMDINNTFEALVENSKTKSDVSVAEILFSPKE